jgi:hypothetical protein
MLTATANASVAGMNAVLFLMLIIGVFFSKEAFAAGVVYPAEGGSPHYSELVGISHKAENPYPQMATQDLIRFPFSNLSIAPKGEGSGLPRLQQYVQIRAITYLTQ